MANEFKISELERVRTIGGTILGTDRLILNNGSPQTTRAITMDDLIEFLPDDVGVAEITAGSNVSISPSSGVGNVTISVPTGAGGVSRIIAGDYVDINPNNGKGEVTINVERGAGGVEQLVAGANISLNPGNGRGVVQVTANVPTFDPGVERIFAGDGIRITPTNGKGEVTIIADIPNNLVNRIIAGSNISISPSNGTGDVTISSNVGVEKIVAGANVTVSPANGLGTVSVSVPNVVTRIVPGDGVAISPGSGRGEVTITSDGTQNFDPIHAEFEDLHFQVRFLGSKNWSPLGFDEFRLYRRKSDGSLEDMWNVLPGVPATGSISAAGLGGILSQENWPISFYDPNLMGVEADPIDIRFPEGSNCALVIIKQRARVLHNFMRSSSTNNTHLAYYTRIAGLPVDGGTFTWKYPGINYEDEGNTGPIIQTLPYLTQLAMGATVAMKGSAVDGSGSAPDMTLNGLDLCYRYGQDTDNLIIAYCEFTPSSNPYTTCRFYHSNRILRSKRSIFDISGASMTFFPLYKPPGAPFPGVQGVLENMTGSGEYQLARNVDELSEVEDKYHGDANEVNTCNEVADDLRSEIARLINALQATHDYGNLNGTDQSIIATALQELVALKSTPVVPNGSLGDNVTKIERELDRIVYDNDEVMTIAGFRFAFEDEFADTRLSTAATLF